MSLKLSLDPRVFKPSPPWSVREPKLSLWVMKKKGLASTSFGGLNSFWGDYQKSNYNPAIVSGQTGSARSFRPLLSLVENWWEGDRATQAATRPTIVIIR